MVAQTRVQFLPPGLLRPDRARRKAAAAGRADIVQHMLHAVGTIGAFIGADPRIHRIRRQIPITQLTIWSRLQHLTLRFAATLPAAPARRKARQQPHPQRAPRAARPNRGGGAALLPPPRAGAPCGIEAKTRKNRTTAPHSSTFPGLRKIQLSL